VLVILFKTITNKIQLLLIIIHNHDYYYYCSKVKQHQEAGTGDATGSGKQGGGEMEHFVSKQRDINGNLQNRIRSLEQQLLPQSDAPSTVSTQTG
jgi:hypothetical protein